MLRYYVVCILWGTSYVLIINAYSKPIWSFWNWLKVWVYSLGQPNWEYTMLKLQDFSATRILREITFGHFEAPKTAIALWLFERLCILNFWIFLTFSRVKFPRYQNSKPPKLLKWQFWTLWAQPKLTSCKIRVAENC